MGFFDKKEPEQQVMDMFSTPPMALLSLYGLINQGRQNVENNLSTLMQPEALKEKLLSPVPNYWGNLSNPEARNRLIDIATEQALNFGPMPVGMMVGPKAVGFDKMRQFSNMADKMPRAEISDVGAKFNWKNEKTFDDIATELIQSRYPQYRDVKWASSNPKVPDDIRLSAIKEARQVVFDTERNLSDVLNHPELYEKYPFLKTLKIAKEPTTSGTRGAAYNGKITFGGSKTITDRPDEDIKTVLHEIQHAIQEHEGWARGGSPSPSLVNNIDSLKKEYQWAIQDGNAKKAQEIWKQIENESLQNYKRLAGEIEARDTAARQALTDLQRMSHMPYESQNIPLSEWIVRMNK